MDLGPWINKVVALVFVTEQYEGVCCLPVSSKTRMQSKITWNQVCVLARHKLWRLFFGKTLLLMLLWKRFTISPRNLATKVQNLWAPIVYKIAKCLCTLLNPHIPTDYCAQDTFTFVSEVTWLHILNRFLLMSKVVSPTFPSSNLSTVRYTTLWKQPAHMSN